MRSNLGLGEPSGDLARWRRAMTVVLAVAIVLSSVVVLSGRPAGASTSSDTFEFWTAIAEIRNQTPLSFRLLDQTKTEMTSWRAEPAKEIGANQSADSVVQNTSQALGHGLAQLLTYGLYDTQGEYVGMMVIENGIDCNGSLIGLFCTGSHRWTNVWQSPMAGSFSGSSIQVDYHDAGPVTRYETNFVFSLHRGSSATPQGSVPKAHVKGYNAADLEPKTTLKGSPWGWKQNTVNHSPFLLKLATTWASQGTTYLSRPKPEIKPGPPAYSFLYDNSETGHGPQSFAVYNAYDPRTSAYVGSAVIEAQTDCEAIGKVDGIPASCLVFRDASFAVAAAIPSVSLSATSSTAGFPPRQLDAATNILGDERPPPPPVPTTTTTTAPVHVKTTTTLSVKPTESRLGEPVRLTAAVKASVPGSQVPTGTVEFSDGTRILGRATLVRGATQADASVEVSDLGIGSHTVGAKYSGDTTNIESSAALPFEVRAPIPVLHVTPSANPSERGSPVTYRIAVVTGLPAIPQGEVIVAESADPKNRFSIQLAGGTASGQLPIALTPGVHKILASWREGSVSHASTTIEQRVLGSAPTTTAVTATTDRPLWGQTVAYTASVSSSSGAPVSGGTVTFAVAGEPYGKPIALKDGTATTKPTQIKLDIGRYPVTATFSPGLDPSSSAFTSSEGSVNGGVIVQPSPTVVQLVSSGDQSKAGDPVTIWVTVTGVETLADGTVTFKVDGKSVPASVKLVNGSGSILIGPSFWTVGRNTVSAQFIPDKQEYLYSTGSLPQDIVPRGD